MMKITRLIASAVLCASLGIGVTHAQSMRDNQTPREFPPSDFQGRQYVDSTGCVFIRAGVDGAVTWVPRVNRQREQICGQVPTFANARPAAPEAPVVTATAPAVRPSPSPAARVVVTRPAPSPQPRAVVVAPRPVPVATAGARRVVTAPSRGRIDSATRVLPVHVYRDRPDFDLPPVPDGYRRAWEDERLNPLRAVQSLGGIARTRYIWTESVPHRLIDTRTGKDMTSQLALVYPYTDSATQFRAIGKVTLLHREGRVVKRVARGKTRAGAAVVAQARSADR